MLFSVDNDSRNLLIHKNQDCGQNSWNNGHNGCPHRVSSKEGNSPATPFPSRGQSFGYYQFGRVNLKNEKKMVRPLKVSRSPNMEQKIYEILTSPKIQTNGVIMNNYIDYVCLCFDRLLLLDLSAEQVLHT